MPTTHSAANETAATPSRRAGVRLDAAELISQAEFLGPMRQALGKTQLDVAKGLGVGQGAVAQLERRSDILVSTLARYAAAMGATLHISLSVDGGAPVALEKFSALRGASAAGKKRGRPSGAKPEAALAAKAAKAAKTKAAKADALQD
jgi:transcriptional regulator with XRE-family HTH domain